MNIIVDRTKCVSLGVCETLAAVFEVDDEGELLVHDDLIDSTDPVAIRDAVASCPVKALSLGE